MVNYRLSDISTQFREFQSPVVLNFLAALSGHEAPRLNAPFRFLVCGERTARSAATLAAAFASGEFHVVETDRAYREGVRDLMNDVGQSNVIFHDVDLDDPDAPPLKLPELDYVCVHGLYAQLGPVGREVIGQILQGNLRDGGLAFMSYCAFPGWAALTPLRALLREAARASHAEDGTMQAPLKLAERLKDLNAEYFIDVPLASQVVELYAGLPADVLVREFLSPKFEPQSFDAVSAQMQEFGLSYLACHPLHLNHVDMALPRAFRQACHDIEDRRDRERFVDFVLNTKVREDVYIKGAPEASAPAADTRQAQLLQTIVGTTEPPSDIERTRSFANATVHYGSTLYETVINQLALGATGIEQLVNHPLLASYDADTVIGAVTLLMAGGQFHAMALPAVECEDPTSLDFEIPSAFNRSVLRRSLFPTSEQDSAEFTSDEVLVCSPVAGNGILIPFEEAIVLIAVSEAGADGATQWAWEQLGAGNSDTDPAAFASVFVNTMEIFRRSRLYKYYELGIVSAKAHNSQSESPNT